MEIGDKDHDPLVPTRIAEVAVAAAFELGHSIFTIDYWVSFEGCMDHDYLHVRLEMR